MRVLFISFDGMTDSLGQSQIIPYLVKLSGKGYVITILSAEKKINFEKNKEKVLKTLETAGINWDYTFYSNKIPVFSQQKNIKRIKKRAQELVIKKKIQVLHCRSYLSALVGLEFKKKLHTKFIFDMRGFWADERIDGGIWKLSNPIQKKIYSFFKKKETEFFKNADYIISLTQNAKNEFLSWPELENNSPAVQVIPCCVDLTHFDYNKINSRDLKKINQQFGFLEDDFVISYLGSLGTWYMLDEMLTFFSLLLKKIPNAKFLIISPDNKDLVFKKLPKFNIPAAAIRVVSATRAEVPNLLAISNFSIYFIKQMYSKKASSPTKMGEILAMGIPIITNTGIGDCDEIIIREKAGYLINIFSEDQYISIIEKICSQNKFSKEHYRKIAEKYFSLDMGAKLYEEVYRKINN